MPVYRTKEEAYEKCISEGTIKSQERIDTEKIKATLKIAEEDLESGKDLIKKERYNSAYKMHYDVLHELTEAYLLFDKIKSLNHQCLFAYLCEKHPELELDWDFFETVRTKRNGINYYGKPVTSKDFKEIEVQINLYINIMKKEIEKKLSQFFKPH